jgi:hypothetical protein
MQITSVRYRELVSLRGCEHKALEATVWLGEPPEPARGSLSLLPFVPLKESRLTFCLGYPTCLT